MSDQADFDFASSGAIRPNRLFSQRQSKGKASSTVPVAFNWKKSPSPE
jgi:hypothetical protein